ncbi:MAG TPA: VOC family protein [archaeon]|nr:VOC family protein [archaeon]
MDKVVHFEIPADNMDRAVKFYKETFGWKIDKVKDMPYYMAHTVETDQKGMPKQPGAINGGLMQRQSKEEKPVVVINVASLDEALKKAQKAGAKVVMPKMDVGGMGIYARIADTEGNVIGVWQDVKKPGESAK